MLFAAAELRRGLYCFMVRPGRALETAAARVVMACRLDIDDVKRSALRAPSRQRNVSVAWEFGPDARPRTPLMFAFGALLTETRARLLEIAAADKTGIAVSYGLENMPPKVCYLTA